MSERLVRGPAGWIRIARPVQAAPAGHSRRNVQEAAVRGGREDGEFVEEARAGGVAACGGQHDGRLAIEDDADVPAAFEGVAGEAGRGTDEVVEGLGVGGASGASCLQGQGDAAGVGVDHLADEDAVEGGGAAPVDPADVVAGAIFVDAEELLAAALGVAEADVARLGGAGGACEPLDAGLPEGGPDEDLVGHRDAAEAFDEAEGELAGQAERVDAAEAAAGRDDGDFGAGGGARGHMRDPGDQEGQAGRAVGVAVDEPKAAEIHPAGTIVDLVADGGGAANGGDVGQDASDPGEIDLPAGEEGIKDHCADSEAEQEEQEVEAGVGGDDAEDQEHGQQSHAAAGGQAAEPEATAEGDLGEVGDAAGGGVGTHSGTGMPLRISLTICSPLLTWPSRR